MTNLKEVVGDGKSFVSGRLTYYEFHAVDIDLSLETLDRDDIPSAVFLCPMESVESLFDYPIFSAVVSSPTESVVFTYTGDTDGGIYLRAGVMSSGKNYELHEQNSAIANFASFCFGVARRCISES